MDAFARKQDSPVEWAQKGGRKEDDVRPALRRMERQQRFGVYFILKSMEVGPSFRISTPKFPTADPHYRLIAPQRGRYTHYSFYIRDAVLGPMLLCVGSFLPFHITDYLNGHHFIERELLRLGLRCRKDDHAFLATADPAALQAAADRLSPTIIRQRLEHWTWTVGPKFSTKDRAAINLRRHYSLQQVEYCRNLIFRRNLPIHKLFERSCDIGRLRLTPDKITPIFGFRLTKRLRGKRQTLLEPVEPGHHVFRAGAKSAVLRMYETCSTFWRLAVLSNRLPDFGLGKSLDNLDAVRQTLAAVTDRVAAFEATALNVHIDFPLFQRLALPIVSGHTKVPGIKLHDTRMVRLMEALLHGGTLIHGWRTAHLQHAILAAFALSPSTYTLTQVRYDLRTLKAHGLIARDGSRSAYRLTDKGRKVALLFVLFHHRVCGPLANSLFNHPPDPTSPPATPLETPYRQADTSIQHVLDLLAA